MNRKGKTINLKYKQPGAFKQSENKDAEEAQGLNREVGGLIRKTTLSYISNDLINYCSCYLLSSQNQCIATLTGFSREVRYLNSGFISPNAQVSIHG